MNRSLLFTLFSITILFNGCAQKVNVRALEPAEVNGAAMTKIIAVTPFQNDHVRLADKIETTISKQRIDGKPYFTLVNRTDMNKVLAEQRLQNSGLIDDSTAVQVGNLLSAQAIISGSLNPTTMHDDRYYQTRRKCKDDRCWDVRVTCMKRTIALSAQIRMIDITTANVIYADTVSRQHRWSRCSDDQRTIPSKEAGAQYLANSIANNFAYKLTPHYRNISVVLLDDPDLEYSDLQEKLLENSLLYIEQNRYDKAEKLLRRLSESTNEQSYVPLYNIGVIYEARGNFSEAQHYYRAADELTIEPVEEINYAINRIQKLIDKEKLAKAQIAK